MKSPRFLLIPLLCFASVVLSPQAKSAVVISETFSSPTGSVPPNWTEVIRSSAENNGAVEIAPISGLSGNALKFHRAANNSAGNFGPNANAAVYYTPSENSRITEFTAEVTLRLEGPLGASSSVGMMLRTQSLNYQFSNTPFSGYYVAITADGLGIYENPTNNSAPGVLLGSLSAFSAQGATDYLFRVSAQGSILTASLWDSTGSTELASVTYSSAKITDGYFGFRGGFGNYSTTAYFRDLTLTVIPEPSSLFLLGFGGIVALRLRRKSNASKFE